MNAAPQNGSTRQEVSRKYFSRVDELESLKVELESNRRPGDPAPIVGRVLEAAGDLLRRRTAVTCDESVVLSALSVVTDTALKSWSDGVVVSEFGDKLRRAVSQAVEAAIPDSDEDGAAFATWVMQDLCSRDRFESALVALETLAARGRGDARVLSERLRRAITDVDGSVRKAITSLTALNEGRRAEAQLLDTAPRAQAWWFSERSGPEDDLVVKVLGGEAAGTLPPALKSAHRVVTGKHERRITWDELFRFDMGLASPAEAAAIRSQASRDDEMKKILVALEQGERAIEELDASEVPAPLSAPVSVEPRSSASPEVVVEREEFKVLVFRARQRVQVVVQPRRQDLMAAAALHLTDDPGRAMPSQPGEMGLHFELGVPEAVAGKTARLVVKLVDGSTVSSEVKL